jgi:hypothetical protein
MNAVATNSNLRFGLVAIRHWIIKDNYESCNDNI